MVAMVGVFAQYSVGMHISIFTQFLLLLCQVGEVEKWFLRAPPSVLDFDDRFQYYTRTILDLENMTMTKDQDFIRLHMGALAEGIKLHARQWIEGYGQKLHESSLQSLMALQEEIQVGLFARIISPKQRFEDSSKTEVQGFL